MIDKIMPWIMIFVVLLTAIFIIRGSDLHKERCKTDLFPGFIVSLEEVYLGPQECINNQKG